MHAIWPPAGCDRQGHSAAADLQMSDTAQNGLEGLLARGMFELVPFNVAVIDRDFHVVAANRNFEEYFGEWRGRQCHQVYKNSGQRCAHCLAQATFDDGKVRVSDETGIDRHGRTCHYVVHLAPLKDSQGRVQYVVEMTTDLTETRHWRREYDLFFERVPCYVLVIDRNFRLIRANEKFREDFGEIEDKHCYQVCKRRDEPCCELPGKADVPGWRRSMSPARPASIETDHRRTMSSRLRRFRAERVAWRT